MIKVEKANLSHIAQIVKFQISMAMETEGVCLNAAIVLEGVKQVILDPAKGHYYVAIDDSAVLGCFMITYEWSDWRNSWVWWLQSLYIPSAYRNRHIFTQMFQYIKNQIIEDNDVCGLRLYVDKTNLSAIEIYEHMGMSGDHYQTFEWMKN